MDFDEIRRFSARHGQVYGPLRLIGKFGDTKLELSVDADWKKALDVFGDDGITALFRHSPALLPRVASEVRIVLTDDHQISARFTAQECADLLGDEWPSATNIDRIRVAVTERKRYPMPQTEIPGGGEQSFGAQGQTKKPGSHSHDRHR